MERDDTVAGPGQNSASESAPDSRGVEFVSGEDYAFYEDGLPEAIRRGTEMRKAEEEAEKKAKGG